MHDRPIGIFDSGVGGLTILSELKKLLPQELFIYVADQAYAPYGTKSLKTVEDRVLKIVHFFKLKNAKLIVIACNTATVQCIDMIRKTTNTPVIGVVPVIKMAAAKTVTKKIAVLTTPATGKSKYLKNLIQKYANSVEVIVVGESGLENLIEEGNTSSVRIETILKSQLLPLCEQGVDIIALGCTHYPFLKDQMQRIVGSKVEIIDSAGAVARQTQRILAANHTLAEKARKDWYYTTGDAEKFKAVSGKLLGKNLENISHITI